MYLVNKKSGCWNYIGILTQGGYGQHRNYYQKLTGKIVPINMTLDHLCRNKRCINPKHLEVVTQKENKRRSSKLSYQIVSEIKKLYNQSRSQNQIAEVYKVNQSTVSRILNNLRWA